MESCLEAQVSPETNTSTNKRKLSISESDSLKKCLSPTGMEKRDNSNGHDASEVQNNHLGGQGNVSVESNKLRICFSNSMSPLCSKCDHHIILYTELCRRKDCGKPLLPGRSSSNGQLPHFHHRCPFWIGSSEHTSKGLAGSKNKWSRSMLTYRRRCIRREGVVPANPIFKPVFQVDTSMTSKVSDPSSCRNASKEVVPPKDGLVERSEHHKLPGEDCNHLPKPGETQGEIESGASPGDVINLDPENVSLRHKGKQLLIDGNALVANTLDEELTIGESTIVATFQKSGKTNYYRVTSHDVNPIPSSGCVLQPNHVAQVACQESTAKNPPAFLAPAGPDRRRRGRTSQMSAKDKASKGKGLQMSSEKRPREILPRPCQSGTTTLADIGKQTSDWLRCNQNQLRDVLGGCSLSLGMPLQANPISSSRKPVEGTSFECRKLIQDEMLKTTLAQACLLKNKLILDSRRAKALAGSPNPIPSFWGEYELDSLWMGVRRYGTNNWKAVLMDPTLRFSGRTPIDLAVKWWQEQAKIVRGALGLQPQYFHLPDCSHNLLVGSMTTFSPEETLLSLGVESLKKEAIPLSMPHFNIANFQGSQASWHHRRANVQRRRSRRSGKEAGTDGNMQSSNLLRNNLVPTSDYPPVGSLSNSSSGKGNSPPGDDVDRPPFRPMKSALPMESSSVEPKEKLISENSVSVARNLQTSSSGANASNIASENVLRDGEVAEGSLEISVDLMDIDSDNSSEGTISDDLRALCKS